MKNIYDSLNDFEISVDDIDLNDFEKRKMLETAESYSKKNNKFPKYLGLVAAIFLLMTLSLPGVRAASLDLAMEIKTFLMDNFKVSSKVDEYKISPDAEVYIGDKSFTLKDLALFEDMVFVNIIYAEEDFPEVLPNNLDLDYIKVKDEKYKTTGGSMPSKDLDQGLRLTSMILLLDREVDTSDADGIELYFSYDGKNGNIKVNTPLKEVNEGNINLLENYKIQNADGYLIDFIKANPITILAQIKCSEVEDLLQLRGIDSLGNEVILDRAKIKGELSSFLYNPYISDIDIDYFLENYKDFSFALYKLEIEKAGSQFTSQHIKISESISLVDN